MAEPIANIAMYCKKHAPKPDARLAKANPQTFIGRHVKIGFKATDLHVGIEHMWVKVRAVQTKTGKLIGVLANDPLFCPGLKNGNRVIFNRDEIEAVMD
jgi:uncharacterized protein YegJ (DUF2314 family)